MKSILYAGAVLMAGACIYGFTDYRNTSSKEEFREMYTEEKKVAPQVPVVEKKQEVVPVVEVATVNSKSAAHKKSVRQAEKTEPLKEILPPDVMEGTSTAVIEKSEVTVTPPAKISIKKKKKKLNSKMFSRAPIREEQELIPDPVETKDVKEKKATKL